MNKVEQSGQHASHGSCAKSEAYLKVRCESSKRAFEVMLGSDLFRVRRR